MADAVREDVTSGRLGTRDLGTLGVSPSLSAMGPVQSVFNWFSH